MLINWVFAEGYVLDPTIDVDRIRSIGPTWGSWKTWRGCSTQNVVCNNLNKSVELINSAFHAVCNFYVPKKFYQDLGRPTGVKLFEGDFIHEVDRPEDIISLHLVSTCSDLVLLNGFNFGKMPTITDTYEKTKLVNYHGMVRSIINSNPTIQWVLIDHPGDLDTAYKGLTNLTCDTMKSVLNLLV